MFKVEFNVEYSKSSRAICRACDSKILKGDMRIYIYHYDVPKYYHLKCYTPKYNQYICKNDIKVCVNDEDSRIFDKWLNEWNINYEPLDKPYHIPPKLDKQVESKSSKYKRAWIEVFRFISPRETSYTLSLVCKEFYHITWDEELWQFYYSNQYKNPIEQSNSWKDQYMLATLHSCAECLIYLDENNFHKCPLLKKPICDKCLGTPKYKILDKSDIRYQYKINPNVLNLKFCNGFCGTKQTYFFMIKKALIEYRNQNKQRILKKFENKSEHAEIKEIVDSIDVENMNENILQDIKLIKNRFYNCFDKIFKYIWYKKGGLKEIVPLIR
ncbi:unnamed protein product [Blepharisma stoltei]|uniref:PARP-type domain-containing protein n=1 Tax=Blepharisma stoltei TaxID=1481888 RepID=A0AAU9INC9_9CILI|nr:unnamed protein product [Blepharisma stoltei]